MKKLIFVVIIACLFQVGISNKKIISKENPDYGIPQRLQMNVTKIDDLETVNEGDDIHLTCNCYFSNETMMGPAIFHQNSIRVIDEESSDQVFGRNSLILRNIDETAAGSYRCFGYVGSRFVMSRNSIEFNVTKNLTRIPRLKGPPQIIVEQMNRIITEFDNVTLKCTVKPDHIKILKHRWFRDSREISPDVAEDGIYFIDETLKLTRILKSTHAYLCEAQTDIGTYYSDPLYINPEKKIYDPRISKYNVTLNIELGNSSKTEIIREYDTVFFTCDVPPELYAREMRFYHNDRELSVNTPEKNSTILIGSSTLIIKNISKAYEGNYTCTIDTDEGWMTSKTPVKISVKDALIYTPRVLTFDDRGNFTGKVEVESKNKSGRIEEFDDARFVCSTVGNKMAIYEFTWALDVHTTGMVPYDQVVIIPSVEFSTLIILHINQAFSANLNCCITTYERKMNCSENMFFKVKPKYIATVNIAPESIATKKREDFYKNTIQEGDVVPIKCEIKPDGVRVDRVEWLHNDIPIEKDDRMKKDNRIDIFESDASLVISNITKDIGGTYRCIPTIPYYGAPISNETWVKVTDLPPGKSPRTLPTVIAELETRREELYIDGRMELKCHIYPHKDWKPNPYWFHGDTYLPRGNAQAKYVYGVKELIVQRLCKTDVGDYTCVFTLPVFDNKNYTSNAVHISKIENLIKDRKPPAVPPSAVAELVGDGDFYECQTAFLYCNIQPKTLHVPPQDIYWFRGTERLSRTNNYSIFYNERSLKIRSLCSFHVENYSCQVLTNNDKINFSSDPIQLPTIKKIYFSTDPPCNRGIVHVSMALENKSQKEDHIFAGDTVTFVCKIEPPSTTVFDLTWYHDDNPIFPSNTTAYRLFTGRTLILRELDRPQSGNYSCEINTKQGRINSNKRVLKVQDLPTIEVYGVSKQEISEFSAVEFKTVYFRHSVISNRTARFTTIRWIFERNKLISNNEVDILYDQQTLVLPCITLYFSGIFICEAVTDGGRVVRSKPWEINVGTSDSTFYSIYPENMCNADRPTVLTGLLNNADLIYAGDTVSLYCYVYPKTVEVRSVGWTYSDKQHRAKIEQGVSGFILSGLTLTLPNIKDIEIGNYTCWIIDGNRATINSSNSATISHVKKRPSTFISSPGKIGIENVTAKLVGCCDYYFERKFVYIYCNVQPFLTTVHKIAWFRDDEYLHRRNKINFSLNRRTLILPNITKAHAGNYSCQVETDEGTFRSPPTQLKNIKDAELTSSDNGEAIIFAIQSETEGTSVNLKCQFSPTSMAVFEIQWYLKKRALGVKSSIVYRNQNRTVTILNAAKKNKKDYRCEANTEYGLLQSKPISFKFP